MPHEDARSERVGGHAYRGGASAGANPAGAATPINDVKMVMEDPQIIARESVASVNDEEFGGPVRMQNVVGKLSRTPGSVRHAGPRLGQHNREILIERLGFGEEEVKAEGLPL